MQISVSEITLNHTLFYVVKSYSNQVSTVTSFEFIEFDGFNYTWMSCLLLCSLLARANQKMREGNET